MKQSGIADELLKKRFGYDKMMVNTAYLAYTDIK